MGILDVKTLSEKWLFELDMPRETCYYICINQDRLEKESGLHKQIVDPKRETKKCVSQGFIRDLGDTSARLWVLRYPHKRNSTKYS